MRKKNASLDLRSTTLQPTSARSVCEPNCLKTSNLGFPLKGGRMNTHYLQDFVNRTLQYKTSLFCLAASCCYLLAGQPQNVVAASPEQNAPKNPDRVKRLLADITEKMKTCDSQSMLDRLLKKRGELEYELFNS